MLDWEPCASGQIVLQDRRVAYAVTDRNLRVQQVSGALNILQDHASLWLGKYLPDLVPELIGSEDALEQILAGILPAFRDTMGQSRC